MRWGGYTKQKLIFFALFFCISFFGCAQQKSVKYEDGIFLKLALTPEVFSKKYEEQLKYYNPKEDARDKGEATKQVYIETNSYRIFWIWQYDKYIPDLFEFTKNIVTIEGVDVIGQSKENIVKIFGAPDETYPTSIVYNGKTTSIGFGFKNGVITSCSMGTY